MNKDLEKELLDLGAEQTEREETLWKEWRKQHPDWKGRDGGPVERLKLVREEYRERYIEIRRKYRKEGNA